MSGPSRSAFDAKGEYECDENEFEARYNELKEKRRTEGLGAAATACVTKSRPWRTVDTFLSQHERNGPWGGDGVDLETRFQGFGRQRVPMDEHGRDGGCL